jgi:hypothetical protein
MIPVTDHILKRASADVFLCSCGMAFCMCPDQRVAEQRHRQHLTHIAEHRATVKAAQKAGRQSDLDGDDPQGRNWCNPFGQGVFKDK